MSVERQRVRLTVQSVPAPVLQRACVCGQHTGGGECAECRKKRGTAAQPEALDALAGQDEARASGTSSPRFGHDFSSVPATGDGEQRPARGGAPTSGTGAASGASGTATGTPLLQDCATWPRASGLSSVLTTAQTAATRAVQGLQSLIGHWGTPSTSVLDKATEMALRKGFNMEPDKTAWSAIGIPQPEIQAADTRDRAAAQTVLDNFRQIAADAPNYQGAPACQRRLVSGSPCLGCVAPEHSRCTGGAAAWVVPGMIGQPSSPIFFCPAFFEGQTTEQMAESFLHEVAHLQTFAATDRVRGTRYYGCPVEPINEMNQVDPRLPGLQDPRDFVQVADSYRCFLLTQREHVGLYEREERMRQRIQNDLRDVTQPSGGTTP